MKRIINTKDGDCVPINVEYTPFEAILINEAMERYVNDNA